MGSNSTNNGAGSVGGSDIVYALAMNGTNNLFVGGSFSIVDGGSIPANGIASWNGNSWNILGSNSTNNGVGVGGIVYALAMNGTNQLFVGGQFSSVDGTSILVNNIASWNGNSWNILGSNSTNNGVGSGGSDIISALAMNGTNTLFVGGQFSNVDGGSISVNNIASWNGNSWNILGSNSTSNGVVGNSNPGVDTLAMNGTNTLLVGGIFSNVDGSLISANNIAVWDGNLWHSIGTESDAGITAIVSNDIDSVFVAGSFKISPDGFCTPHLMQGNFFFQNWSKFILFSI